MASLDIKYEEGEFVGVNNWKNWSWQYR
jgi:hypothetical protein